MAKGEKLKQGGEQSGGRSFTLLSRKSGGLLVLVPPPSFLYGGKVHMTTTKFPGSFIPIFVLFPPIPLPLSADVI